MRIWDGLAGQEDDRPANMDDLNARIFTKRREASQYRAHAELLEEQIRDLLMLAGRKEPQ